MFPEPTLLSDLTYHDGVAKHDESPRSIAPARPLKDQGVLREHRKSSEFSSSPEIENEGIQEKSLAKEIPTSLVNEQEVHPRSSYRELPADCSLSSTSIQKTTAEDSSPGITPGINSGVSPGSTPGINSGIGTDIKRGITPGITRAVTPGIAPGMTPRIAPAITPGVTPEIVLRLGSIPSLNELDNLDGVSVESLPMSPPPERQCHRVDGLQGSTHTDSMREGIPAQVPAILDINVEQGTCKINTGYQC